MTKYIASALFFAVLACSSPDKGGDKKTETTPPANVDQRTGADGKAQPQGSGPSGTNNAPGPSDGTTVDGHVNLVLNLAAAGAAVDATPYFVDVQTSFDKCLPCHANGGASPTLKSFPFTNKSGQTLSSLMTTIAGRINDESRPMPPTGLLPEGERSKLTKWINAGFPAAPAAPTKSKALEAYSLDLNWSTDFQKAQSIHIAGTDTGLFDLALGSMPIGANVSIQAKVTGPKGRVVFDGPLTVSVPDSGIVTLPLRATAVDLQAPALAGSPAVRAASITQTSVKLAWDLASDETTQQSDLVYSVYKSSADNLDTVEHIKANGKLLDIPATNGSSAVASGLQAGVKYFFNVIVTDKEGNEAAYVGLSVLTRQAIVQAQISAQLNLVQPGDTSAAPLTFTEVQPVFTKCMPCHAHGEKLPDLSSFPFVGKSDENLASVMAKIAQRTNDEHSPMPQTGLLPVAQRNQVTSWISSGYLTLPPAEAPSPELGAYSVELRWTSAAGSSDWVKLPVSTHGNYLLPIGTMPIGTDVAATIRVTGPRQTVVLEKSFPALALPATGLLSLPLRANAVDTTAPTPGQHGDIRSSDLTYNSVTLKWTEGRDVVTAQSALTYTLYQARSNTLDTVENIKNNGTAISTASAALTSVDVSNLAASTAFYFNVIVADKAGNEAAYHTYSLTTLDDPTIAIVSEYPGCISTAPTRRLVDAWRVAAAKALESGTESDAAVAQHIKQCFPQDVPACVKPVYNYTQRDDIARAAQDLPIAQAPQRQPPKEFLAPGATGLQYVIPENVEQIAHDRGWPVVRYKSRHAGGFDPATPNLLMVYVPGDKVNPPVNYDRWLNFATPKDTDATAMTPAPQQSLATADDYSAANNFGSSMPRVFTIVSVERPVGNTPAQVFFQMFDRESQGMKFTPRSNSDVTSCVSCHPNGLRAISPLGLHVRAGEAALPDVDWKAADIINAAMITSAGNKPVQWRSGKVTANGVTVNKSFFSPADQGPIMGLKTPLNDQGSRSKAFILGGTLPNGQTAQGCFKRRTTVSVRDIFGRAPGTLNGNNVYSLSASPSIRWEKVRDSMNCASCHDNAIRGGINHTMDMSQVDFKILVDQSMPAGAHVNPLDTVEGVPGSSSNPVHDELTGDERIALANCVQAEFELEQKQLTKWLSQTACE